MPVGDCLLEWDSVDGQKAPVPLLKDMFGSERRKAKVQLWSHVWLLTRLC